MKRESSEELFKRVGDAYLNSGSVKQAVEQCQISEVKARRILITLGLWSSKSSRQVAELKGAGLTTEEIADQLHITVKAVEAYLPYYHGAYGVDEQSASAISAELYRQRQKSAAENMQRLRATDAKTDGYKEGEDDMGTVINFSDYVKRDFKAERQAYIEAQKAKLSAADYEKLLISPSEDVTPIETVDFSYDAHAVYHLHLELEKTAKADFPDSEERADFCKLAKSNECISRDILVPGDMNLHALHYVIQKLFGWQNSHLHDFSLFQEDFDRVTAGRLDTYLDLCGVLFSFPNEDVTDRYWDDDYKEGISFKTWLRGKYSRPYRDLSVGDSWFGNHLAKQEFQNSFPSIQGDAYLVDIEDEVRFDQDFNRLTERLTIGELFAAQQEREEFDLRRWKENIVFKTRALKKKVSKRTAKEYAEWVSELAEWRMSNNAWERALWMQPEETKKEIKRRTKLTPEQLLAENRANIDSLLYALEEIFEDLIVSPTPFVDKLRYAYDYGDDWHITIGVKEVYGVQLGRRFNSLSEAMEGTNCNALKSVADSNLVVDMDLESDDWVVPVLGNRAALKQKYRYFTSTGDEVDEEMREKLAVIHVDGKPLCIAADGLNVLDDCGGVFGYLEMLRTIYGKDKLESRSMREWANGLGWTGRKTRLENMI